MTEKGFIYAAMCNFGQKGVNKTTEYCKEHPKADYDCDDWQAVFYSDPEPIKTGAQRPLMRQMGNNGTHCYTTKQQH